MRSRPRHTDASGYPLPYSDLNFSQGLIGVIGFFAYIYMLVCSAWLLHLCCLIVTATCLISPHISRCTLRQTLCTSLVLGLSLSL
jgi:hypothetical protein